MSEKSQLMIELENLQKKAESDLANLQNESALQAWRTQYLGRSAAVMNVFKRLPEAAPTSAPPSVNLPTR
jgi:phenylalanyl-tRNA synthetase alpha subunit